MVEAPENWKPVVGYEGLYEVSDLGRVRSWHDYGKGKRGGVLRFYVQAGYPSVRLFKGGVGTRERVHVLVASAFIGPRPSGEQVNHLDGDKCNNALANLEYVTPSENSRHAHRVGLARQDGDNNNSRKLCAADVAVIRARHAAGGLCAVIAEAFGVSESTVYYACTRRTWKSVA